MSDNFHCHQKSRFLQMRLDSEKLEYESDKSDAPCQPLNELVLLCYSEHRDWRKCQNEVQRFRECFAKSKTVERE